MRRKSAKVGGAVTPKNGYRRDHVHRAHSGNPLTYVKASFAYLAFMTLWIYAFAYTERHVPGVFILFAILAAMAVHFGAGFAMPRQETFALLALPPLLAILGPGVNSLLWVPLVLMMVFPGAPLLGLWLRNRVEPKDSLAFMRVCASFYSRGAHERRHRLGRELV
jgi:hypothetical protein